MISQHFFYLRLTNQHNWLSYVFFSMTFLFVHLPAIHWAPERSGNKAVSQWQTRTKYLRLADSDSLGPADSDRLTQTTSDWLTHTTSDWTTRTTSDWPTWSVSVWLTISQRLTVLPYSSNLEADERRPPLPKSHYFSECLPARYAALMSEHKKNIGLLR